MRIKHFKEEIQPFARKFYVFGDDGFPVCVDRYAEKVLGSEKYHCDEYKDEAYLFVPYDEEYYKGLSEYIVKAFEDFKLKNEFIPISVIQNKIDEIKPRIEQYEEYSKRRMETDVEFYENIADTAIVQILQEILDERRK